MNIPIKADVSCADGPCGRSQRVIINPTTRQVTHLVVEVKGPTPEVVVPIDAIMESGPDKIILTATRAQLEQMPQFREVEYLTSETTLGIYAPGSYVLWPYMTPAAGVVPLARENVPPGELAVRRGTEVRAADGNVGNVDAFLVDPQDGRISHLLVRTGALWNKRAVSIPVGEIDHIEADTVFLKMAKQAVEKLPDIPLAPR